MNLISELAKLEMRRSRLHELAISYINNQSYSMLTEVSVELRAIEAKTQLINIYLDDESKSMK